MDKDELVMVLVEKAKVTQVCAKKILHTALKIIISTVQNGEKVSLVNFGSFKLQKKADKTVKYISEDLETEVDEKYIPVFTPGRKFKQMVKDNEEAILNTIERTEKIKAKMRGYKKLPFMEKYYFKWR